MKRCKHCGQYREQYYVRDYKKDIRKLNERISFLESKKYGKPILLMGYDKAQKEIHTILDVEFAKYIENTGDTLVASLLTKIIAKSLSIKNSLMVEKEE